MHLQLASLFLMTMMHYASTAQLDGATQPVLHTQCSVAEIAPSSAKVSWCSPTSSASYDVVVEAVLEAGETDIRKFKARSCESEVLHLQPRRLYTVTVKTEDQETKKCSFTTTTSKLTEPRDVKVVKNDPNVLKLKWNQPLEIDGHNIGYLLNFTPQTTGQRFSNERSGNTWYRMENLTSCVTYNISVRAFYLDSNLSSVEGPEAFILVKTSISAPSSPVNLEAHVQSKTAVDLSWSPPVELNGNLDGYIVYRNDTFILDLSADERSCEITDLQKETIYTVKIEAYNKDSIKRLVSNPTSISFETNKSGFAKVNLTVLSFVIFVVTSIRASS